VIFVDTNHVLRWFLEEVPTQAAEVSKLLDTSGQATLQLTSVTIAEATYVLRTMRYDHGQIVRILQSFCAHEAICALAEADVQALDIFEKTTLDYEDCFLVARALQENATIASFDKQLQKTFQKLQFTE
jgi:predicted nucleic acid-binding protein